MKYLVQATLGWSISLAVLAGAFALGIWIAPQVGWPWRPEFLGLLAALNTVWMFLGFLLQLIGDQLLETDQWLRLR